MKKIYIVISLLMMVSFWSRSQSVTAAGIEGADEPQTAENVTAPPVLTVEQARVLGLLPAAQATAPQRVPSKAETATSGSVAYGFGLSSVVQFAVAKPTSVTSLYAKPLTMSAGARKGDYVYLVECTMSSNTGALYSNSLVRYNPKTNSYARVAMMESDGPIIVDMAYSPMTDKMYALGANHSDGEEALYTIDLTTGAVTRVSPDYFEAHIYALAAGRSGMLYGVGKTAELYTISPETGIPSKVGGGSLSRSAGYISSMAMDYDTNTLYWALCDSNGNSYLVSVDPQTAASKVVGRIGTTTEEVMAMWIEGEDKDPQAPNAVSNLTLTPGANGALTATVSWTNPSTTVGGQTLEGLSKVTVSVNGTLKQELTDATPGQASSVTLSGLSTGYARVEVVAVADTLSSEPAEAMKWVGNDVPCAVTGITLERTSPSTGTLTWEAPTTSVHGGYLRTSALKYRITRENAHGDSVVVAKTYRKDRVYIDSTINKLSRYTYTVQSLTNDYGQSAQSSAVVLGPAKDIPYVCQFTADSIFQQWTTIDANGDGNTWYDYTYGGYLSHLPKGVAANDWAITPPINLEADSTYYVYFEFRSGLGEFYPKHMQVTVGTSLDTATHHVVWDYRFASRITEQCRIALPVSKTGEYYIGIHDISDYNSCSIRVANFCVITKHTGWVRGTVTDQDGKALEGVTVTIPNSTIIDTTAADGSYKLDFIPTGTYAVEFSKLDYETRTDSVAFVNDQESVLNVSLQRLPAHDISATVVDVNGKKIVGAPVELSGYGDTRTTTTDADGHFAFTGVTASDYQLKIAKIKYVTVTDSISLTADTTLAVTLSPKILAPSDYTATLSTQDETVTLNWNVPRDVFRHDSGVFDAQLGSLSGTANSVYGAVFTEKAVLKSISWVTTSYQGPHDLINLWIFDITADHKPTSKVLYCAMNVPTKGDEVWNTYELPEPVECPNGYLLGASINSGMVSLATDSGTDPDWPFIPYTNYSTTDYTTGVWVCKDQSFVKRNHLIRATGDEYGQNPQGFDYRYRAWRLLADDFLDQDKWTSLTPATGIAETTITDAIDTLSTGEYVYAVAAVYPDGSLSDIVYSDNIEITQSGVSDIQAAGANVTMTVAAGTLTLSGECQSLELYSAAGAMCARATSCSSLDVSALASGVYVARAQVAGHTVVKRVVIK